jgi:uncharacterized membrane protein YesL
MGFFSVDSPLYKFISRLWDMMVLNFLWFVFSIPIVTIGASTVAAFSVALKMVDDEEGYITRSFVKAFKENLKQGILLGLLTLAAAYLVYLNFALFYAIEDNPIFLLIIGILTGVYLLLSLLYAYPLVARYKNSLINALRNSMQISLKYILRTLLLVFFVVVMIIIIFYNSITMVFGFLAGPAFIIFLISAFSKRIFQIIEKNQEE